MAALALVFLVLAGVWIAHGPGMSDLQDVHDSARAVLHGASPYIPADPETLARQAGYAYPPVEAALFAPVSGLSNWEFATLYLALEVAAIVGALLLLGIRDVRCYLAVLAAGSTPAAYLTGNISLLFLPLLALAWRYRDRWLVVGLATGVAISLKLFLWPLLVWLVLTRRVRASAVSVLTSTILVAGSWALVGFAGLSSYPRLLGDIAALRERVSYSTEALALGLGLGVDGARALTVFLGLVLIGFMVVVRDRPDGTWKLFVLALAASLATSPIVWTHYLAILAVPIAVSRPRFSGLWLVPLAFCVVPGQSNGRLLEIVAGIALTSAILVASFERARPQGTVDTLERDETRSAPDRLPGAAARARPLRVLP